MNLIKKLRVEKGITQTDLAKAIGISKTTASKWESRQVVFKKEHRKKLAKLFGVNEQEIQCSESSIEKTLPFVPETKEDKILFIERLKKEWGI